jgi:glycosyltransferase involved in cell wall biosynthesis
MKNYRGVDLVVVPALLGKHSETLSRSILSIARAINDRFDIIHFPHQGPGILVPVAKATRIPCVVTANGLDWQRDKWNKIAQFAIRSAERTAVRYADDIIVVSRKLEKYFRDVYRRTTVYIPNGIQAKPFPDSAAELLRLGIQPGQYALFAARLVPEKGCHELIEAWNSTNSDKKLVVAGGGNYNDGYVDHLKTMADPEKIIFTGHVGGDLLDQLFAFSYLFILPSHIEGRSVALLEAFSYGRPTLVSDIEENLEVIEGNGFSFRTGDVGSLRMQLNTLLADELQVNHMADRVGLAVANKSNWDQVAAEHEAVYMPLSDRGAFARRNAA